jgi:hypothetical protein
MAGKSPKARKPPTARKPLSEEQREALRQRLALGRERAAANRRAAAEAPGGAAASGEDGGEEYEPPRAATPSEGPSEGSGAGGFAMFLARVDERTREIFSDAELRALYDENNRRAAEERKAGARKRLAEQALHVARVHQGLLPQSAQDEALRQRRMNELVTFTVSLPPTGPNGEIGDIGLRFDQQIYYAGWTYTVTRAQYDSMRDAMYRSAEGELMFEGRSRRYRAWLMDRQGPGDPRFHIGPEAA